MIGRLKASGLIIGGRLGRRRHIIAPNRRVEGSHIINTSLKLVYFHHRPSLFHVPSPSAPLTYYQAP